MKKILILAVLLVLMMLVGCAVPMDEEPIEPTPAEPTEPVEPVEPMEPEAPAEGNIQIVDGEFVPATLTVKVGGTVTWTNMDDMKHLVSSSRPYIKSDVLEKDGVFSYTFDKAGSFDYICALHPGTRGNVVVEE
tara:strand:- start:10142 stop:10543 length:402 start_codon:yes stop_codon:yes gene_type:complete